MIPEPLMPNPIYCLIEGPDLAGKDAQADLLIQHMREIGLDPLLVHEPCEDLPTGQLIRQLLKSGEYPEMFPGLFLADRMALQTNVVKPALGAGRPVVSVRSFLSTICYQAEKYNLDWLYQLHRMLPVKPTHVIILDVDPEEGQKRLQRDARVPEIFEKILIQTRVRERYLKLTDDSRFWECVAPEGWATVIPSPDYNLDAETSKKIVHESVWEFVTDDSDG